MKKTFITLLCLVLIFFAGCQNVKTVNRTVEGSFVFSEQNLPKIAATEYTLDTAISYVSAVLGIEPDVAKGFITVCDTTDECYVKLINNECDIIISHDYGSVAKKALGSTALKLTLTELKKDALVFVTNGNQNVDGLSLNQLKSIFSGEIADWVEFGGEELPITVFTQPIGTAVQGAFEKYIGVEADLPPVTETILIDGREYSTEIIFDKHNGSIGYSLKSVIKHDKSLVELSVDGVKPTEENIVTGKYKLSVPVFLGIRSSEAEGSETKILYDWMISEQGLKCVSFD